MPCALAGSPSSYPLPASRHPQIIPPHDAGIAAAIDKELAPWDLGAGGGGADGGSGGGAAGGSRDADWEQAVQAAAPHPLVSDPMDVVSKEYYARLATLCYR